MHIVLKSTKAIGIYSFVNHSRKIEQVIFSTSRDRQIKVYGKAINFDHIRLVIQVSSEVNYKTWIRLLPAKITQQMSCKENLFELRPYSRIVEWGRQFENVMDYQRLNQMEVIGMRPRKWGKNPLQDHLN